MSLNSHYPSACSTLEMEKVLSHEATSVHFSLCWPTGDLGLWAQQDLSGACYLS
jgi:hypothetical protein